MNPLLAAVLGAGFGTGAFIAGAGVSGRRILPTVDLRGSDGPWTLRLAGAVAAGLIAMAVTGWPVGGAMAAAACCWLPGMLGGKAARAGAIERTEAIASWTEMIRDSIAAASGLDEAVTSTARIAPLPIRTEVRQLVSRMERQTLASALVEFGKALAHPSGDLVVASLTIAARTEAADLSGLLSRLAESIRGEARMRIRVEVGRARVRTATKVILGVVGLSVVLLAVLSRDYLAVYQSAGGQLVLLVVCGIFVTGGWLLSRLAAIEMPERFTSRAEGGRAA